MSRAISNVNISTDTFATLVTKTNEALNSLSVEVLSANSTVGSTGTTASPRHARLIGSLSSNTLIAENTLRGGNTSVSGLLTITSNVNHTGETFTSSSNALFSNTAYFTKPVTILANTQLVGQNISVTSNTYQVFGNTSVLAISVNTSSTQTNTTIAGTNFISTANAVFTGVNNTFGGNVNFDSGTLFVDSVNNRLGIGTTSPDSTLKVQGTANVSGTLSVYGTASFYSSVSFLTSIILNSGLVVNGSTTEINTSSVSISSNNLTLLGKSTSPTVNAAFMVNRGSANDVCILWDESVRQWKITNDGVTFGAINSSISSVQLGSQTSGNYVENVFSNTAALAVTNGGTETANINLDLRSANTTVDGIVQLSSSTSSSSNTTAATAFALKTTYDVAVDALAKSTNATALTTGTVPSARLGSGTANSTTILFGDNTWKPSGFAGASASATATTAKIQIGSVLIQTGRYDAIGFTTIPEITFPQQFSTVISVIATPIQESLLNGTTTADSMNQIDEAVNRIVQVRSSSTTGATFYTAGELGSDDVFNASPHTSFYWQAIGTV